MHTHYDGQVTWDPYLPPSSWHGGTIVVMGNCGVGFAPARPTDLDVIDFDNLTIHASKLVYDLPASGKRLIQKASGYKATICNGEVIFDDGEPTEAMPCKLVRGTQPAPSQA